MELELRSAEPQGAHKIGGVSRGRVRPPPSWTGCGPRGLDSFASIFYIFQNLSPWISGHSENFCFLHMKQHHGNSAENNVSPG